MKKIAAEPYRDIDFSGAKRGAVIPAELWRTTHLICDDNALIDRSDEPFDQAGAGGSEAHKTDSLAAKNNGIPLLPRREANTAVTLELVNQLRDDTP